jgi:(2S)-methylsuccinyl-CoA dehydrogenase
MSLDETHAAMRASVRAFTDREIIPIADEHDNTERPVPDALIEKMAQLGYLGLIFSGEHGGQGLDMLATAVVTEELARGWLAAASIVTRALIAGSLIERHGTDDQRRTLLPAICSGRVLTAAAFTEPDAGSDAAAVALRATREADGAWALTGAKTWCTFADRARLLTILCRTTPNSERHSGLSILLAPKEPGFSPPTLAGEAIPSIGYRGVTSYSLSFDQWRAPAGSLLGEKLGDGFRQLMATYELARIQTAARAVGVAQAALDAAISYARERRQFGVPIAEHQAIRHKLARVSSEIEAARQLTWYAARRRDTGERCDLEAGQAKAFAAEMVERCTSECLQVFGGYGYSREFPAQRYWRDARVFKIFEGTVEIQYDVIAKRLLD